jgi:hypothetical protein
VAVSVNQTPERVRRYVAARRIPGTVFFDRAGKATPRTTRRPPRTSSCSIGPGKVAYTGQGEGTRISRPRSAGSSPDAVSESAATPSGAAVLAGRSYPPARPASAREASIARRSSAAAIDA